MQLLVGNVAQARGEAVEGELVVEVGLVHRLLARDRLAHPGPPARARAAHPREKQEWD